LQLGDLWAPPTARDTRRNGEAALLLSPAPAPLDSVATGGFVGAANGTRHAPQRRGGSSAFAGTGTGTA
jgi:hypothetical protein